VIVDVLVEDPKGSTIRHTRDRTSGEWITYDFPHDAPPWPALYGFIPGTLNLADGDELDVLLLSTGALETGMTVKARAVGVLLRPDEDHKILAVDLDDAKLGSLTRFEDIPPEEIEAITTWFRKWSELGEWADEARAQIEIERGRQAAAGHAAK
jgi:inorganic pyrophosphatase